MVGSAEGARAGRFPALSIRSKLTSAGRSLAGCTSNQPRRPNQRRPALRRGGRGKRTSCSTGGSGGTASDRGRKLRGSFVLGARSGGGYYSLRDSGGVRWISISAQLSSWTGKRRAGGPRGPRRAGRSLGPLVAVPITSVSVAYWVASARPVRRAVLILSWLVVGLLRGAGAVPTGPTRFPCDASLAWDWANGRARPTMRGGTCAAKCGCAFSAVKKAGGRVAAQRRSVQCSRRPDYTYGAG